MIFLSRIKLAASRFTVALTVMVGLLAGGCLEFEETITIRNGGGATIKLEYSLEEALAGTWATAQGQIEEWQDNPPVADPRKLDWILNENLARKYFHGNGIALERYNTTVKNGRRQVLLVCSLTEINEGLATGKFGDFTLTRRSNGDYIFKADLPESGEATPVTAERKEKLQALCRGLQIKITVQVPGKILETTAPAREEKSAVWTFDAAKDSGFLLRTPQISLTFSGQDLTLSQPQTTP